MVELRHSIRVWVGVRLELALRFRSCWFSRTGPHARRPHTLLARRAKNWTWQHAKCHGRPIFIENIGQNDKFMLACISPIHSPRITPNVWKNR